MSVDRFKNFEQGVCDLVLAFEKQKEGAARYFDVDQLEVIADYYLEVYDIEGLQATVEYGEALFPNNNEIKLRRSHLYSIQGFYPQAKAILLELEKSEPDNTDVAYALGALYSMMDQPQTAIAYYLKAANDGYQLDMIYGNVADEYYKMGMPEEAVKYYQKSIANNPEEDRSLFNLACTWDEQGQLDDAESYFSKLVADHPFSKGAWYCLGSIYNWLSLYEKSADAYEYAIAIDKTLTNAYLGLSDSYRKAGDLSKALQALHNAIDFALDKAYVYYCIGIIYLEMNNYHTASVYFHNSLKEDPSYSLSWNCLGRSSELLGYLDDAAGYYRRAIDLDPDSDDLWISLADFYMRYEKYDEACALLESSRKEAEDRFRFDMRLAYCYFRSGRRNRLFGLLDSDATEFAPLYHNFITAFPDMAADPEVLNSINRQQ